MLKVTVFKYIIDIFDKAQKSQPHDNKLLLVEFSSSEQNERKSVGGSEIVVKDFQC